MTKPNATPAPEAKLERLRASLREIGSAAVAFSSGVDSTFLLRVAHEELGNRVVAVTIRSHTFPKRELDEAAAFCRAEGVRHEIIDSDELDIPGFAENQPDRYYHCKKAIFSKIIEFAQANGLAAVLEGSNMDDDGDYRPGRRAIRELGRDGARPYRVYVASPLHDAGFTKAEIRAEGAGYIPPHRGHQGIGRQCGCDGARGGGTGRSSRGHLVRCGLVGGVGAFQASRVRRQDDRRPSPRHRRALPLDLALRVTVARRVTAHSTTASITPGAVAFSFAVNHGWKR